MDTMKKIRIHFLIHYQWSDQSLTLAKGQEISEPNFLVLIWFLP
jgi:hypothetical protein